MPVDGVCHAALEDLSKLGQKLLPEHFPKEQAAAQATVRCTVTGLKAKAAHHAALPADNDFACSLESCMSTEPAIS